MMQNNTGKAAWVSTAGGGGLRDDSGRLVKLWIREGGRAPAGTGQVQRWPCPSRCHVDAGLLPSWPHRASALEINRKGAAPRPCPLARVGSQPSRSHVTCEK